MSRCSRERNGKRSSLYARWAKKGSRLREEKVCVTLIMPEGGLCGDGGKGACGGRFLGADGAGGGEGKESNPRVKEASTLSYSCETVTAPFTWKKRGGEIVRGGKGAEIVAVGM